MKLAAERIDAVSRYFTGPVLDAAAARRLMRIGAKEAFHAVLMATLERRPRPITVNQLRDLLDEQERALDALTEGK